jgi:hypothetical protein
MTSCSAHSMFLCRLWVWVFCTLPFFPFFPPTQPFASEVRLRRQFEAKLDGQLTDCAFAGGMEFSKPAFVDVDSDGDLDIFVGDASGFIRFFRNQGTAQNPHWHFVSDFSDSALGTRNCPGFADVDDDGDQDLFVGNQDGKIIYFRNDGTPYTPAFVKVTDFYDSIDIGSEAAPFFMDIDADSDLDLFIGKTDGRLNFYSNVGTKQTPAWSLVSDYHDSIDVGANSVPIFVEIDADDDYDLFIGEDAGNINFFRNIGNDTLPQWELVSADYNSIDVNKRSAPSFADIDGDSDFDLFIGQGQGKTSFYRNDGSPFLPSWTPITHDYIFLDFGSHTSPALVDIDADGDNDLFVGESEGNLNFLRTENQVQIPQFTLITENYFAIEAEDYSSPAFADIDADGDLDLFVGRKDGKVELYRNIGNPQSALWNLEQDQLVLIDVGGYATPALADIDGDTDLDLFVGQIYGKIYFYKNDGTPQIPSWILTTEQFESIDVGWYSSPAFGDLDLDGDFDLLIGNDEGEILFYRNEDSSKDYSFVFCSDGYDSIDVGERSAPVLSDFDSDGDQDLFVGDSKGGLHYYKNLTLNSIRGKVTDGINPLVGETVYLSGSKENSTLTDSSGDYEFIGLQVGNYCVFREPTSFQYCFSPLDSDTFDINFIGTTQVDEFHEQNMPQSLHLYPNYPNPFNPVTNICYFLPLDTEIKLTIYNLKGEKVSQLANGLQTKGWKFVTWNGKDSRGKEVASGVYFCKLETSRANEIIRMILVK